MRFDLYMKVILTMIAVFLAVSAVRPLLQPPQNVHAQGPFNNIQFSAFSGGFDAFDTTNGDVWEYLYTGPKHRVRHFKVIQLGKELQR